MNNIAFGILLVSGLQNDIHHSINVKDCIMYPPPPPPASQDIPAREIDVCIQLGTEIVAVIWLRPLEYNSS